MNKKAIKKMNKGSVIAAIEDINNSLDYDPAIPAKGTAIKMLEGLQERITTKDEGLVQEDFEAGTKAGLSVETVELLLEAEIDGIPEGWDVIVEGIADAAAAEENAANEEEAEEAEEAPAKKGKKDGKKGKKKDGKITPADKPSKKSGTKKPAKKSGDKKPGVIATLRSFIVDNKKTTKAALLEHLCETFPDREEKSLKNTIGAQMSRINKEADFNIEFTRSTGEIKVVK